MVTFRSVWGRRLKTYLKIDRAIILAWLSMNQESPSSQLNQFSPSCNTVLDSWVLVYADDTFFWWASRSVSVPGLNMTCDNAINCQKTWKLISCFWFLKAPFPNLPIIAASTQYTLEIRWNFQAVTNSRPRNDGHWLIYNIWTGYPFMVSHKQMKSRGGNRVPSEIHQGRLPITRASQHSTFIVSKVARTFYISIYPETN